MCGICDGKGGKNHDLNVVAWVRQWWPGSMSVFRLNRHGGSSMVRWLALKVGG